MQQRDDQLIFIYLRSSIEILVIVSLYLRCAYLFKLSAITEGPHLADDSVALATSVLGHLHLVHAARQQRGECQTNAAKASYRAQDGGRGTAAGIAPTVDAGQADLPAVRASY